MTIISYFRKKHNFIPYFISILIIFHHYLEHYNDNKSFFNKVFQVSDIKNHETWVLFFIGMGIGMSIN